jgi:hypothetical protein
MAMGKRRRRAKQASMWGATQDLPRTAAHPFYSRLNRFSGWCCWRRCQSIRRSRTRRLIDLETHEAVFIWMLQRLADAGLVKGKTVGI